MYFLHLHRMVAGERHPDAEAALRAANLRTSCTNSRPARIFSCSNRAARQPVGSRFSTILP